jgi:hypothetical protein
MPTKKKADPPTLLDEDGVPDDGTRVLLQILQILGDEAARLSAEIADLQAQQKAATAEHGAVAAAAGIARLKASDGSWSAGMQPWRNETIRAERLLRDGWEVACPHCAGALTITTPMHVIEAATDRQAGETWVVRRKPKKKEKGKEKGKSPTDGEESGS